MMSPLSLGAGKNLRPQTGVPEKNNFPYVTDLYCFEPSFHLDGEHLLSVKATSRFSGVGGRAQGGSSSWPFAMLSTPRRLAIRHRCPPTTSGLPPGVPPIQAVGNPSRHTGAFCCSWQRCKVTSGPSALMSPLNNFRFLPGTCQSTRR